MKYFAVLLLAVCLSMVAGEGLTDEQKAKLRAISQECVKETGLDPEIPKKAKDGVYEDTPKFRDYLFCFHKKVGFQNEKGEIQKDVIKEKLGPQLGVEKTDELIAKCAVQKPCPHETAFELAKCSYGFRKQE